MVALKEITWEEASAPGFETSTRQAWRAAVAAIAVKAKQTLPDCAGRVESAVKIVLAGDVELLADGKAKNRQPEQRDHPVLCGQRDLRM